MNAGRLILERRTELAAAVVRREFDAHPDLYRRFGEAGWQKSVQDAGYHLTFLGQSIDLGRGDMFEQYLRWVKVVLLRRGVPLDVLVAHVRHMAEVLREALPPASAELASHYLQRAMDALAEAPGDLPSGSSDLPPLGQDYLAALLAPDKKRALQLVLDAVDGGLPVQELYLRVLQPVLQEIGRLWQTNRISVAQEHYCSTTTQLAMSQLYPHILNNNLGERTLVATCVGGELHEIGPRMVAEFFEMAGWNTLFLGASTPMRDVVSTVVTQDAEVLALSCAYAPNLGELKALVAAVRADPRCARVKVLVGGYPFNACRGLWEEVGADGWGRDALEALACANRLMGN